MFFKLANFDVLILILNMSINKVICTSRDGDRFWKLSECYVRGNSIKYLRIPEDVIDQVVEEEQKPEQNNKFGGKGSRPGARLNTGGKKGGKGKGKGEGKGGKGKGGKGAGRGIQES